MKFYSVITDTYASSPNTAPTPTLLMRNLRFSLIIPISLHMRLNRPLLLKTFSRSIHWGILVCAIVISQNAWSEEVTQNTSFQTVDVTNRKASDESLQHSTSFAMTALMDLGNLNIPSAVNNGMTAYGKYRNSETLDRLGDENTYRSSILSSAGTETPVYKKTDTTFRRLDPSFLRQGQFNEVASEFEKRSGMKRETFLTQLSDVSEKKIRRSDPQLVDKVVGRFESFISKIPNAEFRANLEKGVKMVPESVRSGIIAKAVQKFATPNGPTSPEPTTSPVVAKEEKDPAKAPEETVAAVEAAAPAAASPAPETSSVVPSREPSSTNGKNPLGNIIQAAIDTQENEVSIFQQITKKYRSLTPNLVN